MHAICSVSSLLKVLSCRQSSDTVLLQEEALGGFDYHWLLDECSLVLQAQAKASKPDHGYMAGALAGMSSALAHCQVTIAKPEDNQL